MANLAENSTFDEGVYQLELTDPVIGGPTGISNTPLKNLANRTRYLKEHLDAAEETLGDHVGAGGDAHAQATTSQRGFVELATGTEAVAGEDDVRAVTPAGLSAAIANLLATVQTPEQFDNDISLATTAFVQRALGSMRAASGVSANTTLTSDHIGQVIQCSGVGSFAVTLPLAASVPDGATIHFVSSAMGAVTIQRQSTDLIHPNMATGMQSFTLATSCSATLVKSNGVWGLLGGSAALRNSGDFGASLSANGYQKLPNGLIIQWLTQTSNGSWSGNYTAIRNYPIAFPNGVFMVCPALANNGTSSNDPPMRWVPNLSSLSQVAINCYSATGSATGFGCIAIGY